MPLAAVNDTEIYYETSGEGPPVVLIPGLGQGTNYYEHAIAHLERFAHVIALELRGVGRSARPSGAYSVELWAEDVAALLDHLDQGPAHIVGSSLGGCVAMALVDRHPGKVTSLALVAAFSELDYALELNFRLRGRIVRAHGMDEVIQDHITLWTLGRAFTATAHGQAVADSLREGIARNDAETYLAFLDALLDFGRVTPATQGQPRYTERLRDVDLPTLLVAGANDILTPPAFSQKIADALPPGRAELHVVPDCGHVTFVEAPEATSHLVVDFIKRVVGGRTVTA